MAYDSTDLANVDAAIQRLISGDQIVEVTRDGRTTKYYAADLDMLSKLRTTMLNEINGAVSSTSSASNPRTAVILTRKGL